jgi:hypothetical protein
VKLREAKLPLTQALVQLAKALVSVLARLKRIEASPAVPAGLVEDLSRCLAVLDERLRS